MAHLYDSTLATAILIRTTRPHAWFRTSDQNRNVGHTIRMLTATCVQRVSEITFLKNGLESLEL